MLVIVQARQSSKRFKNKVMKLVNNRPIIWYVLESIKKSKKIKKIFFATSDKESDNKLCDYLQNLGVEVFRGDLNNVANRLVKAAKTQKAKQFMRISGDSPFIDHKIIDKSIKINSSFNYKYDLITNVFPRTFPSGMSVEIIKTKTLEKMIKNFSKFDKEHVTTYLYKNKKI